MQNINQTPSNRLLGYDYRSTGAYFVTICTAERRHVFGSCANGKVHPSKLGELTEQIWKEIPSHERSVNIGASIVMPNHIHGIVFIDDTRRAKACLCPTGGMSDRSGSLSAIIGSFKSAVTKRAREVGLLSVDKLLWQSNYYDHIIRSEQSLHAIQNYIEENPMQWTEDEYFS